MILLEREFGLRKIPVRASDLANTGRDVIALKEIEELLTRPLRGRDEELGRFYVIEGAL